MKSSKGAESWAQYIGAAVLLAAVGYVLFQIRDVNENLLKIPAVRSSLEHEEAETAKSGSSADATAIARDTPATTGNAEDSTIEVGSSENTDAVVRGAPAPIGNSEGVDAEIARAGPENDEEQSGVPPVGVDTASEEETDLATEISANDATASEEDAANEATADEAVDQQAVANEDAATEAEENSSAVEPDVVDEPPVVASAEIETGPDTLETDTIAEQPEQVAEISPSDPILEEIASASPSEPEFDLVRLDASGSGIVAGRADPGTKVRVLSNGIDIGTAEASSRGEFVAFVHLPENDEGLSLSLEALGLTDDGGSTISAEQVLVLPNTGENEEELAPTIVRASDEEIRIIQPGGLGQIDGVTLDTISYDEAGDVVLAGRGRAGESLRVYVDNKSTAEAKVTVGGTWEARFSSVAEGRYVLRVDALDEAGGVSSRVESPFQRIFPTAEQLATPNKITVQPGHSLWLMATERYGSGHLYTQIHAANKDAIRDPDLIFPGQIFEMPSVEAPENN